MVVVYSIILVKLHWNRIRIPKVTPETLENKAFDEGPTSNMYVEGKLCC